MFAKQLTLLSIITIELSSIQCGDPQTSCPQDETYVKQCVEVVTCEARVEHTAKECDGQCVCINKFTSRNDQNQCIPVWDCPGVCPPHSYFQSCTAGYFPDRELGFTAEEFIKACKPKCFCSKGYFWKFERRKCFKIGNEEGPIHKFLHFG